MLRQHQSGASPPLVLTRCCGYGFGAANDLKSVSAAVAAARPLNGGGARAPSVPPLIRDWIKLSSLWSWRIAVALSLRQRHCVCVCLCARMPPSHHTACNACTITTFTKHIKDKAAPRMSSKSAAFSPLPPRTLQSMYARIDPLAVVITSSPSFPVQTLVEKAAVTASLNQALIKHRAGASSK